MSTAERDTAPIEGAEPTSGSNTEHLGSLIGGRYVLDAELGRGAMGVVYAARHRELGTPCAVKVMFEQNPTAVARLLREAKIAAALECRHIVKVRDFGTFEGKAFVVMDRLEGLSLDRIIEARAPLPESQVIAWGKQICAALSEAHSRGVVHRDLKPANVFIEHDGQLRVLDFGVAKLQLDASSDHVHLTHEGTLVGSPSYMAPEQIRDARQVDLRADLWSLGVTLYECLTGRCPFRGAHVAGTLAAVSADTPSPLPSSVSRPLAEVIERCLQKEPNDRFASAHDILRALEAQPRTVTTTPSQARRAAAIGLAVVGFASVGLWMRAGERMKVAPAQPALTTFEVRTQASPATPLAAPLPVGAPSPSQAGASAGQTHHVRGPQPATASAPPLETGRSAPTAPGVPKDIHSAIGERH